jgi:hypothetical protein
MHLRIPLDDLRLVLPFRSETNPERPHLTGIAVQPVKGGGCMLVATDGRILAAYHSKNSQCDQDRTLELPEAFEERVGNIPGSAKLTLRDGEQQLMICDSSGKQYDLKPGPPFIEKGSFPDWKAVIPNKDELVPGSAGTFRADYLAIFKELLLTTRGPYCDHVVRTFTHKDAARRLSTPTVFLLNGIPGFVMFAMPIRVDEPAGFPDWMSARPRS